VDRRPDLIRESIVRGQSHVSGRWSVLFLGDLSHAHDAPLHLSWNRSANDARAWSKAQSVTHNPPRPQLSGVVRLQARKAKGALPIDSLAAGGIVCTSGTPDRKYHKTMLEGGRMLPTRIATVPLTFIFLLATALPERVCAGWSSPEDFPTVSTTGFDFRPLDNPVGCVSWGADRLDCFLTGNDGQLYQYWGDQSRPFPGPTAPSFQWTPLGTFSLNGYPSAGKPVCISWAVNRIDCFIIGESVGSAALWQLTFDGQWRRWQELGPFGLVGCTTWAVNRIDCIGTASLSGDYSALVHRWWDGNNWGAWELLGGVSKWAECLSSGPNRLDCFVVGTDGAIWHRWWDGNTWQGWTSLNGTVLSFGGPSCTSWAIWRIDCFVIGTDTSL
jgi:hypothetical protein